jgi:DNA-binding PadR family transcriptional regulator
VSKREPSRDRANDPPLLILTSLSSGPKHGHALLLDIESFAGVRLGPGTLYGAITRLEQRGLIEPLGADERRRPYSITVTGIEYLALALSELGRIVDEGRTRLRGAPRQARVPGAVVTSRPAGDTA